MTAVDMDVSGALSEAFVAATDSFARSLSDKNYKVGSGPVMDGLEFLLDKALAEAITEHLGAEKWSVDDVRDRLNYDISCGFIEYRLDGCYLFSARLDATTVPPSITISKHAKGFTTGFFLVEES